MNLTCKRAALETYKTGKWAKQILAQRREDGLWGNFHALSCPVPGKSYTTEQAIRRLYYLGYTVDDEVIQTALRRMEQCVKGELPIDDYSEKILTQFIRYSGRPVVSMEAATRHPLQSFADLITIEEYKRRERPKVVLTWAPHPKSLPQAVPNSFVEWMKATDYEFVITHPHGYELSPAFTEGCTIEYDQKKAFEGADFIYAKNWSAFADPNYGKVISMDKSWTVDKAKMDLTDNAYFMHCLPVRRNMIVTDEVIDGPNSIVIPEAANRVVSAQTVLKEILLNL